MSLLINQPLPGVQHGPTPGGVDSTPTTGVTSDPMRAAIATHFRPGGQQSVHASETPARQSPPGLAKTTTDLALAPRLGAEGKLFARAENLVANVLDGEIPMRQGMRELQALRHEALAAAPGDQNTKAAFNALCTTLVLSPLKNAGLAQNPAMARALEFTLHAQLDRVLGADSPEILDQARTEIEATRRLFHENGKLGADQALTIETLQGWIETKALALTAIDTLAPRVAARQADSGHEPLATVLDAATTLRADLVSSQESSTVPLRDMALTVLSPRVDQQIAALEDLSTARYAPLDEEGQNLLRETRSVTVDNHVQAPPAAHVEAHDAAVTAARDSLAPHHFSSLTAQARVLREASAASDLIQAGRAMLQTDYDSMARLEQDMAGLEAAMTDFAGRTADMGVAVSPDLRRLAEVKTALIHKRDQMDAEATRGFHETLGRMERGLESHAADPQTLDTLFQQTASMLAIIDADPKIGETSRARLHDRVANLQDQALTGHFSALAHRAESSRLSGPSLEEIQTNLAGETRFSTPQTRADLQAQINELSTRNAEHLSSRLEALTASAEVGTSDPGAAFANYNAALRQLRQRAGRTLVEPQRTAFLDQLDTARAAVGGRLAGAALNADPALAALGGEQLALAKELFVRSSGDTTMMTRLAAMATSGGLGALATAVTTARSTPSTDNATRAEVLLDRLTLDHRGLDALALELKLECCPEADRDQFTARHASTRANREITTLIRAGLDAQDLHALGLTADTSIGITQLESLVSALGEGNTAPRAFDLLLIKALWAGRVAKGKIATSGPAAFAGFQGGLPAPYRDTPNLRELLGLGLDSLDAVKSLGADIAQAANALGGGRHIMELCKKLASSNDVWAARTGLTDMARNLLHAHGVTGTQAMQGGRALRATLQAELTKNGGVNALRDSLREALRLTEHNVTGTYEEQLAAFVVAPSPADTPVSRAIDAEASRLLAHASSLDEAVATVDSEVQKWTAPLQDVDVPRVGGVIDVDKMQGETLSTGLLALRDVLDHPDQYGDWMAQRDTVADIHFQRQIEFTKMRGSFGLTRSDDVNGAFTRPLDALATATSAEKFAQARTEILAVMDAHGLSEKSQAVLALKTLRATRSLSGVDNMRHALKKTEIPEGSPLHGRMLAAYAPLRGTADRSKTMGLLGAEQQRLALEKAKTVYASARDYFSTQVNQTVDTAVRLAVLDTFLATGQDSWTTILEARDQQAALENWDFFRACQANLKKLGLPEDLGNLALKHFLLNADAQTLARTASHNGPSLERRIQHGLLTFDIPDPVRQIMHQEEARQVATDLLGSLRPGHVLNLSLKDRVTASIPVFETEAVNIGVTLEAALGNGMGLWRDASGVHLALDRTLAAGAGVSVDALCGTLSAQAGVSGALTRGAHLVFADDAKCSEFLGAVLSGTATERELGLCAKAYVVRQAAVEAGIEATVDLTALIPSEPDEQSADSGEDDGSWISAEARCGARASAIWKKTGNAEEQTTEREFAYDLSLAVDVALGGDQLESVTQNVDKAVTIADSEEADRIGDRVHDLAEKIGDTASATLELSTNVRVRSTVHASTDGTVVHDAGVTRSSMARTPDEVTAFLRRFGISEAVCADVTQDLEDAGNPPATVEVTWRMHDGSLRQANASPAQLSALMDRPDSFELAWVRIAVAEQTTVTSALNLSVLGWEHSESGGRTAFKDYDPTFVAV